MRDTVAERTAEARRLWDREPQHYPPLGSLVVSKLAAADRSGVAG